MGQQPISQRPGTQQALAFFSSVSIQTLAQISQWEAHSQTWIGWCFPHIPANAKISLNNLKTYLHGIAPSQCYLADELQWDPSGTIYTIKAAYD